VVFDDPYAIFVEDRQTDDGEMRYQAIVMPQTVYW
jgi:uncharacterized DUF497 family protein